MLEKPPTENAVTTNSAPSSASERLVVARTCMPTSRCVMTCCATASIGGSADSSTSINTTCASCSDSWLAKSTSSLGVQCVLPPPTMVTCGVVMRGPMTPSLPAAAARACDGSPHDPLGTAVRRYPPGVVEGRGARANGGSDANGDAGSRRDRAERRRQRRRRRFALVGAIVLVIVAGGGAAAVVLTKDDTQTASHTQPASTTTTGPPVTTAPPTTTTTIPPYAGWVDPASAFTPYYHSKVAGLLTFRGDPTRDYYGQGPVPAAPHVVWKYPGKGMCSLSEDRGETTTWCGNGWTGEPAVFERDGRTWVVFNGYDRAEHFVDAATGQDILPPFPTGDIIKGSVTVDPDGYPLVYFGSRDNYFRVVAIDRPQATELYKLSAERGVAGAVERRLGRQRVGAQRLPVRGRREQPDPHREAQPVDGSRRARAGRAAARVPRAGLGRPGAARRRRHRDVDRELGRDLGQHALLRELRRARAGLGHLRDDRRQRPAAGTHVPLLDRGGHRRIRRRRRTGDVVRRLRMGTAQRASARRSAR